MVLSENDQDAIRTDLTASRRRLAKEDM